MIRAAISINQAPDWARRSDGSMTRWIVEQLKQAGVPVKGLFSPKIDFKAGQLHMIDNLETGAKEFTWLSNEEVEVLAKAIEEGNIQPVGEA